MAKNDVEDIGKWVYSRECEQPAERKTKRWMICAKDGEVGLGEVKWFGKWRCYAFFPLNDTIYEKSCLRTIATFCEIKTNEHRSAPPSSESTTPEDGGKVR